jgi:DNA-binding MarR family transcriptional regulator
MEDSSVLDLTDERVLQEAIETFWETFPPVWRRIRSNLRVIIANHFEITVEEFHILRNVCHGVRTSSELATTLQISRPAVSQAVDGLVEKGLLSRQTNTRDRRFVTLDITSAGSELINKIFQQNRSWMKEKMTRLSTDEVASVNRAMKLLKNTFVEPAA